ncbi:uncharacterized protein CC84DRAFT_1205218 [Paraphaeosphaeria sporulosa]|uniref:Ras modification protein ERF4 n=1 Tax=Paraphaeosphaeria sporulosa TaxID=1460663 RepID=A0A177CCN9_9PLEO|nr:uncharacterized protein CC84DRAFT_1205218 [Paraphaeosphaeria sporulosa]OAG05405.1 hypothetical protein CC84DRAFT_1205218 [Paraphaeosphaeria sporulosa]
MACRGSDGHDGLWGAVAGRARTSIGEDVGARGMMHGGLEFVSSAGLPRGGRGQSLAVAFRALPLHCACTHAAPVPRWPRHAARNRQDRPRRTDIARLPRSRRRSCAACFPLRRSHACPARPDHHARRSTCTLRRRPLRWRGPESSPPNTTASHDPPAAAALPARWSLTNRLFGLRSLHASPPRPPASRLWNPVNSSPRALAVQQQQQQQHPPTRDEPNLPVQRQPDTRDEYPLLTLPEQRLSRQSPAPSSLAVQRSTGPDSSRSRTSIALPRDRRSLRIDSQPQSPIMALEHDQAPADAPQAAIPGGRPGDLEAGAPMSKQPTRASLPSRPNSMHSHEHGDQDDASEFPWGPSHPCFPHSNPHVPLNSPLYDTTRIIRIKRDWMVKGDLAPTYANLYPEILDPLISEEDFRKIVQRINDSLVEAFDPFTFRAWLDAVMGVATFWLWDDAGLTKVKRKLAELEDWIENWNKNFGENEGVRIIPLRRTGYLTLDIQIPDPHLGPDNSTASRPNTHGDSFQNSAQPGQTFPTTPTFQVHASSSPIIAES